MALDFIKEIFIWGMLMKNLSIVLLMILITGCAVNKGKALLISTGTGIGLKVGVSETTQIPEVKLGYYRAEGAVVPVSEDKTQTVSVLAKLNFQSIWKDGGGISSLIATGNASENPEISKLVDGGK